MRIGNYSNTPPPFVVDLDLFQQTPFIRNVSCGQIREDSSASPFILDDHHSEQYDGALCEVECKTKYVPCCPKIILNPRGMGSFIQKLQLGHDGALR